jgi:hypothetical protein
MGLVDGREVLIADTPAAFAEAVARVYTDGALWNRLSAGGLQFVREHYSFGNGAAILRRLLAGIGLAVPASAGVRSTASADGAPPPFPPRAGDLPGWSGTPRPGAPVSRAGSPDRR